MVDRVLYERRITRKVRHERADRVLLPIVEGAILREKFLKQTLRV